MRSDEQAGQQGVVPTHHAFLVDDDANSASTSRPEARIQDNDNENESANANANADQLVMDRVAAWLGEHARMPGDMDATAARTLAEQPRSAAASPSLIRPELFFLLDRQDSGAVLPNHGYLNINEHPGVLKRSSVQSTSSYASLYQRRGGFRGSVSGSAGTSATASWQPILNRLLGKQSTGEDGTSRDGGLKANGDVSDVTIGIKRVKSQVILNPLSAARLRWDLLIVVCILYELCVLPLRMSFSNHRVGPLTIVGLLVDGIFIVDISLSFRTGIIQKSGQFELDAKKIRMQYLKSYFIFDVLASFPYDLLLIILHRPQIPHWLQLPRLLVLLRLPRLSRYMSLWQDLLPISKDILRMVKMVFAILLFAHFDACANTFVASWSRQQVVGWTIDDSGNATSPLQQYTFALFMAISTMIACGYGPHNYAPVTMVQMWLMLLSLLAGCMFYVTLVGMITTTLGERAYASRMQFTERRMTELVLHNEALMGKFTAVGLSLPTPSFSQATLAVVAELGRDGIGYGLNK